MAFEATAQHQHHHQRQRQDSSGDYSPGDPRDPGPAAVKTTISPDPQPSPTGDRGCDDDKKRQ